MVGHNFYLYDMIRVIWKNRITKGPGMEEILEVDDKARVDLFYCQWKKCKCSSCI